MVGYYKLLTNLDPKISTDVVFTISSGREFHSLIVYGKKENLKTSYFSIVAVTLRRRSNYLGPRKSLKGAQSLVSQFLHMKNKPR